MAPLGMIRQLSDSTYVWEIPKIYKLVKNIDLGTHSPDFIYGNTSWDISMYKTSKDAVHFTNFSLWRKSYSVLKPRVTATYRLYIKDQRGKEYWWSALISNEFNFDKREGTTQTLRDLDVLKFIYYNTPSDLFSLYVTFDSAETSLVRTGSLRVSRRKSFIQNIMKRRGSFSTFENEHNDVKLKSFSGEDSNRGNRRVSSPGISSNTGEKSKDTESFIKNIIKRRGSYSSFEMAEYKQPGPSLHNVFGESACRETQRIPSSSFTFSSEHERSEESGVVLSEVQRMLFDLQMTDSQANTRLDDSYKGPDKLPQMNEVYKHRTGSTDFDRQNSLPPGLPTREIIYTTESNRCNQDSEPTGLECVEAKWVEFESEESPSGIERLKHLLESAKRPNITSEFQTPSGSERIKPSEALTRRSPTDIGKVLSSNTSITKLSTAFAKKLSQSRSIDH